MFFLAQFGWQAACHAFIVVNKKFKRFFRKRFSLCAVFALNFWKSFKNSYKFKRNTHRLTERSLKSKTLILVNWWSHPGLPILGRSGITSKIFSRIKIFFLFRFREKWNDIWVRWNEWMSLCRLRFKIFIIIAAAVLLVVLTSLISISKVFFQLKFTRKK